MKIRQLISEAPKIGRKYQHIEDLVLTNGFHGAMHAIERLRDMSSNGGSIELKWDGMPVVYWGRDEKGVFHMIPKNAWAYLKAGKTQTASGASTVMNSPKDVKNFVLGTGGGADEGRQAFANQFASLWPYFEKISPKKGFIEGGVLFHPGTKPDGSTAMPTFNKATGTYDFTPNITTFHVPADSDLGRRIKGAKLMVAATGYYPSMGSDDEQRFPDAEQLSQPGIIVQGTTYVQEPVKVDEQGLANLEQFLKVHKDAIEKYLAPKKGLSNPGGELYNYLNQHLRTQGLVRDFPAWAKSKLSPAKALAMTSDGPGLQATLGAVEAIGNEKMKLIGMLSQGLHGGMKQTKPEGYAQAHPNTKFKYDIPGQFVKAIDQMNWAPKKIDESIQRTGKSDTCVIGWGRGMGHSGHMLLASAVLTQAKEMGADPYFIVSKTVGKDDPLFPEEKLAIYRKVFPQFKNVFQVATDDMSTLNKVLENLSQQGYRRAVVVVGEDQVQAFQFLVRPNKTGEMVFKSLGFDDMRVISRQQTNDPGKNTAGPRATPMREILMDPEASEQKKFAVWRGAMSPQISDQEVLDLMRKAESRMKNKVKVKECLGKMRPLLKEGTTEQKIKMLKKLKEMVSGGVTLSHEFTNDQTLRVNAMSNDKPIGAATFVNYGSPDNPRYKGEQVHVDEQYRGKGIATKMYDLAKKLVGNVHPSDAQTGDGEAFWQGKEIWEEKSINEFYDSRASKPEGGKIERLVRKALANNKPVFVRGGPGSSYMSTNGDKNSGYVVSEHPVKGFLVRGSGRHKFYTTFDDQAQKVTGDAGRMYIQSRNSWNAAREIDLDKLDEFAPPGSYDGDDSDIQLYIDVAKKVNMKKYEAGNAHDLIAKKMAGLVDVVEDEKVDYARHVARKAQGMPNMLETQSDEQDQQLSKPIRPFSQVKQIPLNALL
jgi:hypothetical protein